MEGEYITTKTRSINYLVENKDTLDKSEQSPLPLHIFPNYMGINLCNVESMTWARQDDGQLLSLSVQFVPATELQRDREGVPIYEEGIVEPPRNRYIDTEKVHPDKRDGIRQMLEQECQKEKTDPSEDDINHPKWNNVRAFLEKKREKREKKRERLDEGLPRDEIVSHIMKTKNMTLGEASRFIKENGLYKTPEDKKDEKVAELEKQLEVLRAQ